MERAAKHGFVVIQLVIGPGEVAGILALDADDDGWEKLFSGPANAGSNAVFAYDDHRLQRPLPQHIVEELDELLREKWQWFYPNHVASNWVLIKSLPGGKRQALHTDFKPTSAIQVLDFARVPPSLMIALQPGTRLHTYGWNRLVGDEEDERVIELQASEMLIFRGDMIHAGASYNADAIDSFARPRNGEEARISNGSNL